MNTPAELCQNVWCSILYHSFQYAIHNNKEKKNLTGYSRNTYLYSGKKLPIQQVTLPKILCYWLNLQKLWQHGTDFKGKYILKPHSLIQLLKPIICTYKAYTVIQYPVLRQLITIFRKPHQYLTPKRVCINFTTNASYSIRFEILVWFLKMTVNSQNMSERVFYQCMFYLQIVSSIIWIIFQCTEWLMSKPHSLTLTNLAIFIF